MTIQSDQDKQPEFHKSDVQGNNLELNLLEYQGPIQTLLELVEQHEMDINAIALATVASQFAMYVREAKLAGAIPVEQVAQYVSVASRLLLLKSRTLIPKQIEDEPEAEDTDIGALIDALKEYRKFSNATDHLSMREGTQTYPRTAPPTRMNLPEMSSGLDGITLQSLVEIIGEVLERLPDDDSIEIDREPIVLEDRISRIRILLDEIVEKQISFRSIIEHATSRAEVIVDFLAVLELIKSQEIMAEQNEQFGEIYLIAIGLVR